MRTRDMMYYFGWLAVLILAGVWMLLWALGSVSFGDAFLLWLLSIGLLLVVAGALNASRGASNFQLAGGLALAVFMLIMLAVASDVIGGFVGAAVGIILIGIIGLMLLLRNIRLEA